MEPAFENAGQVEGTEIWRIEDFKPIAYPKNDYGKFYTGDSYIVLKTKQFGGKLNWNIHFWLGAETSQDEAGTAAMMTVVLDSMLGGGPIQFREVQEHESKEFLDTFKDGVRYLPGGVESGFNHYEEGKIKLLYHIKGKKDIRCIQVPPNISNMNEGDCFILDCASEIYVYMGKESSRREQLYASKGANVIRDQDHSGRSKIIKLDPYADDEEFAQFFEALGEGSRDEVPAAKTAEEDEADACREVTLVKVSDESGSIEFSVVARAPLNWDMLSSDAAYVLDSAGAVIYVWVGKDSSDEEKKQSFAMTQQYLMNHNFPAWTSIQRIPEGTEPAAFKAFFKNKPK